MAIEEADDLDAAVDDGEETMFVHAFIRNITLSIIRMIRHVSLGLRAFQADKFLARFEELLDVLVLEMALDVFLHQYGLI